MVSEYPNMNFYVNVLVANKIIENSVFKNMTEYFGHFKHDKINIPDFHEYTKMVNPYQKYLLNIEDTAKAICFGIQDGLEVIFKSYPGLPEKIREDINIHIYSDVSSNEKEHYGVSIPSVTRLGEASAFNAEVQRNLTSKEMGKLTRLVQKEMNNLYEYLNRKP